ncbi:DDE-type integrase/transposase/recombinase [Gluconacetobacter aggeris]|uniref:DDE-type integrase/transposase/recombinase n=1 Tax=Gluconacetobacter aggeris TaxID=1286186 RepID=A0A7W4IWW2_9PROT|nr:Mu transposase C-terminal domain-containing protein [Gluconacetobacter aggeris]MBB2170363.1 DDE-type integrase/transposase/recombinase [Gluconacetobacter aggeris]
MQQSAKSRRSVLDVSSAAWELATKRSEVLRPLVEADRTSRLEIALAAQRLGLSIQHTYRLIKKLKEEPTASALVHRSRGPRPGSKRLPDAVERLITVAVEKSYQQREKPTLKRVYRELCQECRAVGRRPPSMKAFRARVAVADLKKLVRRREGPVAADARFHQIRGSLEAAQPLQIVQIDHTKVDLMLVDDLTRSSIGRPWLTLVLDVHTRMVLGFLLSLEAPSAASVALAVTQAVLPKDGWRAERLIEQSWPTAGIPTAIHVDNGAEFHSRAFERGCAQHGIEVLYRPPATPRYGGHIERLMGTLMGRIQALPGTTFSNVVAKGDYPAEARACLSFREFERILALEVLGPYHNEIHRSLGCPPAARWAKATQGGSLRHPVDDQGFLLDFLPFQERVVRRDGVRLFNIQYQDGALAHLLGQPATKMRVKYDPRNLAAVFVELPDGDHVRVPYADLRRAPITLWEHREAVRALRDEGRRSVDEHAIFGAIAAQRAILDEARGVSRQARRNAVRREMAHTTTVRGEAAPEAGHLPAADDDARIPLPPPGMTSGVEIW